MRRQFTSLLVAALLLMVSFPVGAAETPPFSIEVTANGGHSGSAFDLKVSYNGLLGPLGVFVIRVDFTPACFTCQRVEFGEGLKENYTASASSGEGQVAAVYTQRSEALAYKGPSTAVSFRFQVREDALQNQTEFRVRIEQVTSPQGESLCGEDIEETLPYDALGPVSSEAALLSLEPDEGGFDQPFSPDQFFYTMSVPNSVSAMTFTAVAVEGATFRVDRKKLGAGGSSTEFKITVTAEDGKTEQVYQVDVYREPLSEDASLLHLAPDVDEFDQEFSPGRLDYTMSVPYEVAELNFTAEPAEGAKCRVNRTKLGAAGSETEFQITVTAEDGKTKQIYRVTVYRELASSEALLTALAPDTGELEQEFSPERLYYTMRVPYETTAVTFTAVPIEGASCKVNRTNLGKAGSTTVFEITVTAADQKTKQVYQVDVYREEKDPASADATLLSLEPDTGSLDQPFSPDELDYTMTVPFSVKSLTFQTEPAEGATCRVNRKNLGAGGSDTEFLFTVTAADKETKQTYRVMVHREEQAVSVPASTPKTTTDTASSTAKTKTPQPSASPSASPKGVPVPVEEDASEAPAESALEIAIDNLPEGIAAEGGDSPFVYVMFAGMAGVAVCLSGPIARWMEKRKGGKSPPAPGEDRKRIK